MKKTKENDPTKVNARKKEGKGVKEVKEAEIDEAMTPQSLIQMLSDLDEAQNVTFDKAKEAKIQMKLSKERNRSHEKEESKQIKDNEFIPYPEYDDPEFYSKISNKKEFQEREKEKATKKLTYDEVVEAKCSSSDFKLTQNQIFLKNFISQHTPYNGILLFHGVGVGKCFAKGTPILMFDGSTQPVEDVIIGDFVMGDDSSPRKVRSLACGIGKMYRVFPEYGSSYTVNSDHVLCLVRREGGQNDGVSKKEDKYITMTVKEYMMLPKSEKMNIYGYRSPITFFSSIDRDVERSTDKYAYMRGHLTQPSISRHSKIMTSIPFDRSKFVAGFIDRFGKLDIDDSTGLYNDFIVCPRDLNVEFIMRSIGLAVHTTLYEMKVFGKAIDHLPLISMAHSKKHIRKCDNVHRICIAYLGEGRYHGFGVDGNHKFLLGDFTVTHNSCSAISIAEQFSDTFRKRVLVLAPSSLSDNFKQQIFDPNRMPAWSQCTGSTYAKYIPKFAMLTEEARSKEMNRIIESKYEFMGFLQFANHVNRIATGASRNHIIKREFSNRVIIIDEAHNVRDSKDIDMTKDDDDKDKDKGNKIAPPVILEVLQKATNIKLVLLTATPMYNVASEIVWLLNFLLANDKRAELDESEIFNKSGDLTSVGKVALEKVCKGYVSYMRGENPFSFPLRLYPSVNSSASPKLPNHYFPEKDNKGILIEEPLRLKTTELVVSHMSAMQMEKYKEIILNDDKERESRQRQVSNVVYPSGKGVGKKAFDGCFDRLGNNKFSYKKDVLQFLGPNLIKDYAPKIKAIIDSIKKAEGVIYVYTFYIECGIVPLALALEHEGYVRYGGENLLSGAEINEKGRKQKPPMYAILSAANYTPDFEGTVNALKAKSNRDGNDIKVILGTTKSAEGWDFKFIREVHILEPWYHLNKVEQIVGRAIRNCSHVLLPVEKRNVTVFQHISMLSKSDKSGYESTDQRVYRIAENKQIVIDKVEMIMKKSSVDCIVNKSSLFFEKNIVLDDVITSQGKHLHKYLLGDKKGGKYWVQCNGSADKSADLDMSTFNQDHYKDEIDDAVPIIASLFKTQPYMTYDEIRASPTISSIGDEVLKYTLDRLVNNPDYMHVAMIPSSSTSTSSTSSTASTSYQIIYRSNLYILQPSNIADTRILLEDRANYKLPTLNKYRLVPFNEANTEAVSTESMLDKYNELRKYHIDTDFPAMFKNKINLNKPPFLAASTDYVVDRLPKDTLFALCAEVVSVWARSEDDPARALYKEIRRSLIQGHILVDGKSGVWFVRDDKTGDLFYAQETSKPVSVYDKSELTPVDKLTSSQMKTLRGFFGYKKNKDDKSFNVLNEELSKEVKDSDRKKPTTMGSVCSSTTSFSVTRAVDRMKDLNAQDVASLVNESNVIRKVMCTIYEMTIRMKSFTQSRIFMRPYEATLAFTKEKTKK